MQSFIRGGGGGGVQPSHSEFLGSFANAKVISKLNHEICHQDIMNSWLCYSFLGEALGGFSNP